MAKLKKLPIPIGWKKVTRGRVKKGDRVWDGIIVPPRWVSPSQGVMDADVKLLYCCIRRKLSGNVAPN